MIQPQMREDVRRASEQVERRARAPAESAWVAAHTEVGRMSVVTMTMATVFFALIQSEVVFLWPSKRPNAIIAFRPLRLVGDDAAISSNTAAWLASSLTTLSPRA